MTAHINAYWMDPNNPQVSIARHGLIVRWHKDWENRRDSVVTGWAFTEWGALRKAHRAARPK